MISSRILSDPVSYIWSQTDNQVSVSFLVPNTTHSKDVVIKLQIDQLDAGLRGIEPIIKGKLYAQIRTSGSVWQMEPASKSTLVDTRAALKYQLLTLRLEKWVHGVDWPIIILEPITANMQVDIASQFYLGKMYESVDPVKAFNYYLSAAGNGHVSSQLKLAAMYEIGKEKSPIVPVERSIEKSFYWHQKAAKYGNAEACYIVGTSYSNGHGVRKSYPDAIQYFKKAMVLARPSFDETTIDSHPSQAGGSYTFFVNSAFRTGLMYLEGGNGIVADPSLALEFWKQSAAVGHAQSMYNTGILYLNGVGTEKNLDEAARYIQNAIEIDPRLKIPEALMNYKPPEQTSRETRRNPAPHVPTLPKSRECSTPSPLVAPVNKVPLKYQKKGRESETFEEELIKVGKSKRRKSPRSRSKSRPVDGGVAWFMLGSLAAFTLGLVILSAVRQPGARQSHTIPRSVSRSVAGVQVI